MSTVYDFSAAKLTNLPGAVGAMLYFGTVGRTKNATAAQVATLLAKGYQIGGVYENNASDWAQGRAGGQRFAYDFDADVNRCGLPGLPGAFTADTPGADPVKFVEMLRGANDVIGVARTSAYGYLPHLIAARNAGVASRFWLTGHCPNPMPPWINLYQHNGSQPAAWGPAQSVVDGTEVDHSTVLLSDWGQHPAPTQEDTLDPNNPADNHAIGRLQAIANRERTVSYGMLAGTEVPLITMLDQMAADLTSVKAGVGALSDDEAHILTAIRGVQTAAVDEASLAAALAPLLAPLVQAGATAEQIQAATEAAVRKVFASAGQNPA